MVVAVLAQIKRNHLIQKMFLKAYIKGNQGGLLGDFTEKELPTRNRW